MPTVFVPSQLREHTSGAAELSVEGATLRDVLQAVGVRHPRLVEHVVREGQIIPGLAVAIDGAITNRGLLAETGPHSEVHFLPAIGAG